MQKILLKEIAKKIICVILMIIIAPTTISVLAQENTEGELEYVLSDDLNYYIVNSIGTFEGKDVVVPKTYKNIPVKEIAASAFSSCLTMETLYVPATIERIGRYAFQNCRNLKSATILCSDMGYYDSWSSENLKKEHGYSIFYGCSSLADLYICDVEFEAQISSTYNYINYYPIGYIFGNQSYSGSVACSQPHYIGDRADHGYRNYYFPSSLKTITLGGYGLEAYTGGGYTYPFAGNLPIEKIIVDDGINRVARGVFYGLKGINTVVLPESITDIEYCAFYDSDISNIVYRGTSSQWSQITIEGYNDDITDKVAFQKFTRTTISEDGKTFVVNPINIENGKTVILALYDEKGLVEVYKTTYAGEEIPFSTTKAYTGAKVFVWDNWGNIAPVCEAETVKE